MTLSQLMKVKLKFLSYIRLHRQFQQHAQPPLPTLKWQGHRSHKRAIAYELKEAIEFSIYC